VTGGSCTHSQADGASVCCREVIAMCCGLTSEQVPRLLVRAALSTDQKAGVKSLRARGQRPDLSDSEADSLAE
jgi:hypothetical protein